MTTGIYRVFNTKTRDCYVSSSLRVEVRYEQHKMQARNNKHHSKIFQNVWNKYGENSFIFILIEECQEKDV